jgi:molybdopterin synthase sulfur carrier subunit
VPHVRIPPILRPEAGNNRVVEADGTTVREVLENLAAAYPGLRDRIFADGGELPQFLNVFIDGADVRLLDGLETAVADEATVILLPAVAGGGRAEPAPPFRRPPLCALERRGRPVRRLTR